MKKFKFRLEPLMRYREFLERQKRLEVAKARSDVLSCEKSIEQTRAAFSETVNLLEDDLGKGMDAAQFLRVKDYLVGLETFEDTEKKRRKKLLDVLTRRQKELAGKTVEKKVIEKLKLRQKEEYYTVMLKEEQKSLDDIVILRQAGGSNT
jgi:flagellar FliJ protein